MSDRGLQEAIRAAGGVTELARRIGVTQPSVSNWRRVPAERVLAVEEVTGVARDLLRPDLYADDNSSVDDVDLARARIYSLLGDLLPYGSFYLTGFLHERPLARLREDLARFGIDRAEGVAEPEDHAGILCE